MTLLIHDMAGLDMNSQDWKQLCRKVLEADFDCLQIDRFAKMGQGKYGITICNKTTCTNLNPWNEIFSIS